MSPTRCPSFDSVLVVRADIIVQSCRMLRRKARVQDVEIMKADGQKRFSLLDNGILDQSITKLLLVNVNASSIVHPGFSEETNKKRQGMNDEIFPVEDSMIPLQNGDVKSVR